MLSKRDDNADAQKVYTARRRVPRSKSPLSIESPVGSVGGTPAGYIYIIYMLYERELTAMTATVCAYNAYTESNKARVLNHVVAGNGQIDMDRTRLTVYYIVIIPTLSQYIYIYINAL